MRIVCLRVLIDLQHLRVVVPLRSARRARLHQEMVPAVSYAPAGFELTNNSLTPGCRSGPLP